MDMELTTQRKNKDLIEKMFKAGAHFAFSKSRRHPSSKPYIYGVKNRVEIFDLEKTSESLERAKVFAESVAKTGGQMLFLSSKKEAAEIITRALSGTDIPFVAGRWIGGTLTNFSEIKKRVQKMEDLIDKREKGELSKYTKMERLLIDKDIKKLENLFGGIRTMKELPKALFIVDHREDHTARNEANQMKIPIISLAGSDSDMSLVEYPIPANDSSISSINFFVDEIVTAYKAALVKTEKKEVKE